MKRTCVGGPADGQSVETPNDLRLGERLPGQIDRDTGRCAIYSVEVNAQLLFRGYSDLPWAIDGKGLHIFGGIAQQLAPLIKELESRCVAHNVDPGSLTIGNWEIRRLLPDERRTEC
jgi:hypothetical protein